jgi:hypothetical protein
MSWVYLLVSFSSIIILRPLFWLYSQISYSFPHLIITYQYSLLTMALFSSRNERMTDTRVMCQPKPKFVAHKDPTRGKKEKVKTNSNRLGNQLHMA